MGLPDERALKCTFNSISQVLLAAGGTDGLTAIYATERKKIKTAT